MKSYSVASGLTAMNGCTEVSVWMPLNSSTDCAALTDLSGGWNIGVVVGPSGSGKTSIGRRLFDGGKIINLSDGWNTDRPIIDDIAPARDFNIVTGMLAEVNRLLSQGWTLTKRTTMSMPVVLTDAFSSCTEQALYAELERIQPEYPEEVTL